MSRDYLRLLLLLLLLMLILSVLNHVDGETLERDVEKEPTILKQPIHLNLILNRVVLTQHRGQIREDLAVDGRLMVTMMVMMRAADHNRVFRIPTRVCIPVISIVNMEYMLDEPT